MPNATAPSVSITTARMAAFAGPLRRTSTFIAATAIATLIVSCVACSGTSGHAANAQGAKQGQGSSKSTCESATIGAAKGLIRMALRDAGNPNPWMSVDISLGNYPGASVQISNADIYRLTPKQLNGLNASGLGSNGLVIASWNGSRYAVSIGRLPPSQGQQPGFSPTCSFALNG